MKKLLGILLAAAMVTALFAGCAGSSTAETTGADTPQETTEAAPAETGSAETAAPAGTAGETIVRLVVADTPVMDPAVGVTEAATAVYPNVYDAPVWPEPDGSVSPLAAESWEISEDGMNYTFKVRQGMKFHDGSDVTAEDFAYSMDRACEIGQGFGFLWADKVESSEVIDDFTVCFHLNTASGTFLSSLARLYILNKNLVVANQQDGAYGENGDYGMTFLQNMDAGSGPYMVENFSQDSSITVKQFADYWDGFKENNPEKGQFIIVDETVTQVTMMANRELEISNPYMALETYDELEAMDGIELAGFYKGDIMFVSTNNKKAPLDDEHVRKALACLIDYDTLIATLYPGSVRTNSCVPTTVMGYDDNAVKEISFNIDKAKEELAQSKYADTIGDYDMTIAWVANCPDREKIALMLQANAQQLGINLSIVEIPWASIVETSATPETTYDMVTVISAPDYPEAGSIFESCFKDVASGSGNPNTMNWAGSPELDAVIKDATSTTDFDTRKQKYIDLQEEFMKAMPTIPLFEQNFRYAYQAAYMTWDCIDEGVPPLMGYNLILRKMHINPENMPA